MKTLNKLLIAVGAAGLTSTVFVLYKLMTASEGEWIIYIDVDVVNQHFFSPSGNSASALHFVYSISQI